MISTDALQHDVDASVFGYPLGQIPRMDTLAFPADKALAEAGLAACREANPEIKAIPGRIVSGDQFISDNEKKVFLTENFRGCCTEMEGAAIAQAAYLNGVPFLIIRAISDKADDSAQMDYDEFEKKAVEHSVNLMLAMARRLA